MSPSPDFTQMWRDLEPLGRSSASGGYFRQPFTSAEREAASWFLEQCRNRGLEVTADEYGNVVAWWRPEGASGAGVLTGSHLDSVLDGGAYDGPLGVVSALAAIDVLRDRGTTPAKPIGVAVFVEEEGSRFGLACLGSRLLTGATTVEQARDLWDRDGVFFLDAFGGPDASDLTKEKTKLDGFTYVWEQAEFEPERDRERVPEAAADQHVRPGPERQVRPMERRVEEPVAEHERADDHGRAAMSSHAEVETAEQHRPGDGHHQAVRPGVVHEVERVRRHQPGHDAHAFDAGEQQDRPEQVDELRGRVGELLRLEAVLAVLVELARRAVQGQVDVFSGLVAGGLHFLNSLFYTEGIPGIKRPDLPAETRADGVVNLI